VVSEPISNPSKMEAYERRLKEQEELIAQLVADLNKKRAAKEVNKERNISIELNEEAAEMSIPQANANKYAQLLRQRKRKSLFKDDNEDAREAAIRQVFK